MRKSQKHRAAKAYANLFSWSVFPLAPGQKVPLIARSRGGRGFLDATTRPDIIDRWWTECPNANIGIATGKPSNVFAIDIDPRNNGDTAWAELVAGRELPETPQAITGGGGAHLLFAGDCQCGKLVEGVDLKGTGGYVVGAPSVCDDPAHAGRAYCWEALAHPCDVPVAAAPEWLRNMIGTYTQRNHGPATGEAARSFLAQCWKLAGWAAGPKTPSGNLCVQCPWANEHSDNRGWGRDTSTVIRPPTTDRPLGRFHCSHSHCQHRGNTAVLLALPRAVLVEMASLDPDGFRTACRLVAAMRQRAA